MANENIQIEIELDYNLVIIKAFGVIYTEDLIDIFAKLYARDDYLYITRIVTDFRGAKALIELTEIEGIIEYITHNNKNKNVIYNAILTDEPSFTAIAVLYQHALVSNPDYYCSVFNQIANAARFIHMPKDVLSDILQRYDIISRELVK